MNDEPGKLYTAEFIGTYFMVFCGTAAIVVNDLNGGVVTHVGVSLVFGLVVAAVIYAVGDTSGAHINPAVTIGFWVARRFPGARVAPYIASQVAGALAASLTVKLLFAPHATLGATLPSGSALQSLILEVILTFILMFVILNVSTGAKEKGLFAGIAIGGVVALEALFAGPVSGASMNPARSLAPAIMSGQLHSVWIYVLGPVLGACLAFPGCRCIRDGDCCAPAQPQGST